MKRVSIVVSLLLALGLPATSHAQWGTYDEQDRLNPYQYRDVDDGQFLMFASYVLTPIGMGLEWGLTRPLHYTATQTVLAPILSGDKDYTQFGQNNNADLIPPETFAPPPMNFSTTFVPAPRDQPVSSSLIEQAVPPSTTAGRQPAIH